MVVARTARVRPGLALALVLLACLGGCRRPGALPEGAEQAVLKRQVHELRRLVDVGKQGPLVPFDQVLIMIHQSLLEDLLTAALPFETLIEDRFRIRVSRATVRCEDGLALVRLDGRASFNDESRKDSYVEATVFGALEEFDLDPQESVLRGRVNVIAFETSRATVMGGNRGSVRGLVQDLARLRVEAFREADYTFDIPVRLVHDIALPEVGPAGGVHIREAKIPLQVSVTDVKAFGEKLWISVRLYGEAESQGGGTVVVEEPAGGGN